MNREAIIFALISEHSGFIKYSLIIQSNLFNEYFMKTGFSAIKEKCFATYLL